MVAGVKPNSGGIDFLTRWCYLHIFLGDEGARNCPKKSLWHYGSGDAVTHIKGALEQASRLLLM